MTRTVVNYKKYSMTKSTETKLVGHIHRHDPEFAFSNEEIPNFDTTALAEFSSDVGERSNTRSDTSWSTPGKEKAREVSTDPSEADHRPTVAGNNVTIQPSP